jgi:GT2 family glycosyltransferase
MDLSIIIPSYNTKDLLDRCLESIFSSIKHSTYSVEVIVVDNNSTDGSVEMLNKKYEQVIKVFNKENVGYGKANNIGIKKSNGTHILLLNSDCKVLNAAIETLFIFSKKHDHSFVGGKLLNEDMTPQASGGPFYSLPVVFAMLFLKGDAFHVTRSSPKNVQRMDWISGACIMAPKKIFEDVGGFDEGIFMYMEEIDLLYRAKKMGYDVWFNPEAYFVHSGAASAGHKKEPVVNIYRGLDYFYEKHYSQAQRDILKILLSLKAWCVILICGIIGNKELEDLYAKALAVLS